MKKATIKKEVILVLSLGLFAQLLTAGCEDLKKSLEDYFACDPNETRNCYCQDGSEGMQLCAPDSGAWEACICDGECTPSQELCDGIDNDCDGLVDEEIPTWYADDDGDGHGNPSDFVESCAAPDAGTYVLKGDDCDDSDAHHWSDCGRCQDADGDHYGQFCDLGADCDDTQTTGAACIVGCDTYYTDNDDDGYGTPAGPTERCSQPQADAGLVDNANDCDDTCDVCWTDSPDVCDGLDNDCTAITPDGLDDGCAKGCDFESSTIAGSEDDIIVCYACNPNVDTCCYADGTTCGNCCKGICDSEYADGGDWKYRIELTVDASMVVSSHTDFPVYVDLSDLKAHFLNTIKPAGEDIRVTLSDGVTPLPLDVYVTENNGAKGGALFFRADALSATKDTIFYIYYGNDEASDSNSAQDVWDDKYVGVWHLESSSTVAYDSTARGNDGAFASNASLVDTGLLGAAAGFESTNDTSYIEFPYDTDFELTGAFTLSAWVKPNDGTRNDIFNKGGDHLANGFSLSIVNDTAVFLSGDEIKLQSAYPIARDQWTHVVVTASTSALSLYLNGSLADTTSIQGLNLNAQASLFISNSATDWGFDGAIDEARVSRGAARSADWIMTTYNNQSSPSTFYRVRLDSCDEGDFDPTCQTDEDGDGALSTDCPGGFDCDDSSETGWACIDGCMTVYQDADNDRHGDPNAAEELCPNPDGGVWGGYAAVGDDCDDQRSCHDTCKIFERDADGDGRSAPDASILACPPAPDGYIDAGTDEDCDDSDSAHWSGDPLDCDSDCADLDGDDFGANCDLGGDCNDNDKSVHEEQTWFRDSDGDGYGDPTDMISSCELVPPEGYVADKTDWNDGCETCYPDAGDICDEIDNDNDGDTDENPDLIWYRDCDRDSFTDPENTLPACSSPSLDAGLCDAGSCNCPDQWSGFPKENDCDDDFAGCNSDCVSDLDLDGTRDCADPCIDYDRDGYGFRAYDGGCAPDCNDYDKTCDEQCVAFYPDLDGDGYGDGRAASRLVTCEISAPIDYVYNNQDCDDNDPAHWSFWAGDACDGDCIDDDQDGWGANCDQSPDCNDQDNSCYEGCTTFYRDLDGDGYGAASSEDKGEHADMDAGVYMIISCSSDAPENYAPNKDDCFDGDSLHWSFMDGGLDAGQDAAPGAVCDIDCNDPDNDGYGAGCDMGDDDCDNTSDTGRYCHQGCNTYYRDNDGDGHGDPDAPELRCVKPEDNSLVADQSDCDDDDGLHWADCENGCDDDDEDGYGEGCDLGPDCDDRHDSCHEPTDCVSFYLDADKDGYGGQTTHILLCSDVGTPYEGISDDIYTKDNTDCDDSRPGYWSGEWPDCDTDCWDLTDSEDDDGDGYGPDCDRGAHDCAPSDPRHWSGDAGSCDPDCSDNDNDGYGDNCDLGTDCDDDAGMHWSDCGECTDFDGDGFGDGCDLGGYDCDDSPETGSICHKRCEIIYLDADGDGARDRNSSEYRCSAPYGYLLEDAPVDYCDDDYAHWSFWSGYPVITEGVCDDDCIDEDGDGLGENCDLGDDCDDSLETGALCSTICHVFYHDADGDGIGDSSRAVTACALPEDDAYTDVGGDCDDSPNGGADCQELASCNDLYIDMDGDGFGDPDTHTLGCAPTGYFVDNNSDCDDDDGAHWSGLYPDCDPDCIDEDGDGYGVSCDLGDDCNDYTDAGTDQIVVYYLDMDSDGHGNPEYPLIGCAYSKPHGYAETADDCDDNVQTGASCHELRHCTPYYRDDDGDSFGDGNTEKTVCTEADPPMGYVANDYDCDDNDIDCTMGCNIYLLDLDKDGYGDPLHSLSVCSSELPDGYRNASDGTDCDDSLETGEGCHTGCGEYFYDSDGDGYGDPGSPVFTCGDSPPADAVDNRTDCDDRDSRHWLIGPDGGCDDDCVDDDGDGYGAGCDLENDCDDDVRTGAQCPSLGACVEYYRDADEDSYGDESETKSICSAADPPIGYVQGDSSDCDDSCPTCYPGAEEICDGLDNNCSVDGGIDEGLNNCVAGNHADGVSCSTATPITDAGIYTGSTVVQSNSFETPTADWCGRSPTPGNDEIWKVTIPVKNRIDVRYTETTDTPADDRVVALFTDCGNIRGTCLAGANGEADAGLTYVNESDEGIQAYLIVDGTAAESGTDYNLKVEIGSVINGDHCANTHDLDDPTEDRNGDTRDMSPLVTAQCSEYLGASDGNDEVWSVTIAKQSALSVEFGSSCTGLFMYLVSSCNDTTTCLALGGMGQPLTYSNPTDSDVEAYLVVDGDIGVECEYGLLVQHGKLCETVFDCPTNHMCFNGQCRNADRGDTTCYAEPAWDIAIPGTYSSSTAYHDNDYEPACAGDSVSGEDEVWNITIPVGHKLEASYSELELNPYDRVLYLVNGCELGACLAGDTHSNSAEITYINSGEGDKATYLICDSTGPGTAGGGGARYTLDMQLEEVPAGDHCSTSDLEEQTDGGVSDHVITSSGIYSGNTTDMSNLQETTCFDSSGQDEVWKVTMPEFYRLIAGLDASWSGARMYLIDACADNVAPDVCVDSGDVSNEIIYKNREGEATVYLVVDGSDAAEHGSYALDVTIEPNITTGPGPDAGEPECSADADCADSNVCTLDLCIDGMCVNIPRTGHIVECDGDPCTTNDTCDNEGNCEGGDVVMTAEDCHETPVDNTCTLDRCEQGVGCVHINMVVECYDNDDPCIRKAFCADGACLPDPRYDCSSIGLVCDPHLGCVGCIEDGDCGVGEWCNGDVCDDCRTDTRCGSGCINCELIPHDHGNYVCDNDHWLSCVECNERFDCGAESWWCNDHVCEECKSDTHCGAGCDNCLESSKICKDDWTECVECNVDSDCAPGDWCDNYACAPCNVDQHCTSECVDCGDQVCIADGSGCVECNMDDDCIGNEKGPFCETSTHMCVECLPSDGCTDYEYCATDYTCQLCATDDQCGAGCGQCSGETPRCVETDTDYFECAQCADHDDCDYPSLNYDVCDGTTIFHYTGEGSCEEEDHTCKPNFTIQSCSSSSCSVSSMNFSAPENCITAAGSCDRSIAAMYASTIGAGADTWSWETGNEGWDMGDDWLRTQSNARTGSYSADFYFPSGYYSFENDRNALSLYYDLSTCLSCDVNAEFSVTGNAESGYDFLRAQCRGATFGGWTTIEMVTGSLPDWTVLEPEIPSSCLADDFKLALLFTSDWMVSNYGYYVDDVRVYNATTGTGSGEITSIDASSATGWACHSFESNGTIEVALYFYKEGAGEPFKRVVTADAAGGPISAECGTTGNHGWILNIDPRLAVDLGTGTHEVRAFGIEPGACGGEEWELNSSPMTFTL